MNSIVVYKSKYGSTRAYAEYIAKKLSCRAAEAKNVSINELLQYDAIIYGGGLYAEIINGVSLITANINALSAKKIAVFSTGITPMDCREYYDGLVLDKNFKSGVPENLRVFNFPGKMILSELSLPHRAAIRALKKLMSGKKNPTKMEKLLADLCDADGDFSDMSYADALIKYINQ